MRDARPPLARVAPHACICDGHRVPRRRGALAPNSAAAPRGLGPVQIATPRHHNPAQAPAQQHDKYAGAALPTSDIFGGAYIPEMMQAPLESAGERVKRIHSTAPPAPDRDVSTPPAATFVGHAAAAATAVPAFPGMTPGSSTPRVHGYTVVPPGGQAGSQTPRRLDDAFSASTHRAQDEGGPAGRPALDPGQDPAPLTPRRSGAPLTPRGATRRGNGLLTPRSQNGLLTPRGRNLRSSGRDRSVTPEKRDSYAATKGGWIQTSVTISDMNIAAWTQQKQDMFIEAVAATAQVLLSFPVLRAAWSRSSKCAGRRRAPGAGMQARRLWFALCDVRPYPRRGCAGRPL